MRRIAARIAVTCLLMPVAGLSQQTDFSKVEIETVPVADGIYMLLGAGGNIGVLTGPDGVILIDDQWAPMTGKITAAVAELTDEPIRMVLNTHWHPDHTGGNENFAKAGAVIIAHENVRRRMSAPFFSSFFQSEQPASPPAALPVITFADSVTLHLNGQTVRVTHLPPAHSDGDAYMYFEEANVVHMGDVFFNGFYPFIDHGTGGSVGGMIVGIDRVLPLLDDDTRIIPGHGPLSDRAGLLEFRTMLATVLANVQALIDEGKTRDEIIAAKPSADFDARWGQSFIKPEQWIGLVCQSLDCQ